MDNPKYIITREQLKEIVRQYPNTYALAKKIVAQSKGEDDKCILCDAQVKEYWHRITPGLVKALAKAYAVVCKKGRNEFDKNELNLDHSEYGNFQKLRFHALIAKNDKDKRGNWLITRRGSEFLQGVIRIPARVKTYRNRVIDHDPETLTLRDVIKSEEYWEKDFDYDLYRPNKDITSLQQSLL